MITIGITGTGSLIGQAIIKSIKKSSFAHSRLVGMDYFEHTIGSYWVNEHYILPDIIKDKNLQQQWIEKIIAVIEKEQIKIIFIGVDFELILFSKYKTLIEEKTGCVIIVSSEECIRIADDKYLTYDFLKKNDLFFPKTFLPEEFEEAVETNNITFPTILKPRNGYRSRDVYIIQNKEDLRLKVANINEPIIQEMVGNQNTEYTCGIIVVNNLRKSIVLRRDLKEGNTSTAYYLKNHPKIITQYIEDVSKKLDIFGVCNFQLRIDASGIPKIFEINSRHSGTTYMRTLFGFNEIEFILEYIINGREIDFNLKEGTVKRYYEEFYINEISE